MATIGAFEAKNTLGSLLDRVEAGEEIVITRHGRPVARLVPNATRSDADATRAAMERIRSRASHLQTEQPDAKAFDWETLKKVRDENRP